MNSAFECLACRFGLCSNGDHQEEIKSWISDYRAAMEVTNEDAT